MVKFLRELGKFTSRKIFYIIALTSVFWFSLNILLLIANNQSARESLESLVLTSDVRSDSHYMKHVKVLPLFPAHNKQHANLPWLKEEYWETEKKDHPLEVTIEKPGRRGVYDVSDQVNVFPGKGEGGIPSYLDTEEEKKYAESIFKNHSFNSVLSEKISLDRTMKDFRHPE